MKLRPSVIQNKIKKISNQNLKMKTPGTSVGSYKGIFSLVSDTAGPGTKKRFYNYRG